MTWKTTSYSKLSRLLAAVTALFLAGCETREKVATGVFAVDPVWTFETSDDIIATPQVSGDTIILRTEKQVIALDGSTRTVLWTADLTGSIHFNAPPIIVDSLVIVPEYGNPLVAYDLVTGAPVWRYCLKSSRPQDCASASASYQIKGLESAGGVVVVSRFEGDLTGHDASNGELIWYVHSIGRGGPFFAISGTDVYFDWHDLKTRQLQAVSLVTGSYRWDYDFDDVSGQMVIQNGIMYLVKGTTDTTKIVALTLATSSKAWELPFPGNQAASGTYLMLDDTVLFAAADKLAAISIDDGSIIWETSVAEALREPVVFGNIVIARDDHVLYAFDKHTGAEIGQLTLELTPGGSYVELNPAVYGDLVLIPVGAKQLAAYRLEMPSQ